MAVQIGGVSLYGFCEQQRIIRNLLLPTDQSEGLSPDVILYLSCGAAVVGLVLFALSCYAWSTVTAYGTRKIILITAVVGLQTLIIQLYHTHNQIFPNLEESIRDSFIIEVTKLQAWKAKICCMSQNFTWSSVRNKMTEKPLATSLNDMWTTTYIAYVLLTIYNTLFWKGSLIHPSVYSSSSR